MKIFLVSFILLLFHFPVLAQFEVSVPALVEVTQKNEFNLYDLVILKQGTTEDLESLKQITISDLTKKGILESMKESPIKAKIIFEEKLKILTTVQINKNELQRKVLNHLTADCNSCIYEIQINKLPFVNSPTISFRSADFEFARGSFMLPLLSTDQGNRLYSTGSWKTFKKISVANKWMGQGYRIATEDLKEVLKEITFLKDKLVERDELVGKQLSRTITTNSIITRDLLVVEKLIKKGDSVRLIIKEGPFEIETSAQAQNDGLAGDSISVKANQKIITAKVVSKDKVVSE